MSALHAYSVDMNKPVMKIKAFIPNIYSYTYTWNGLICSTPGSKFNNRKLQKLMILLHILGSRTNDLVMSTVNLTCPSNNWAWSDILHLARVFGWGTKITTNINVSKRQPTKVDPEANIITSISINWSQSLTSLIFTTGWRVNW